MLFLTCNYIDNAEQSSLSVALLLLSTTCSAILIIIALLALAAFSILYKRRSRKFHGKIAIPLCNLLL